MTIATESPARSFYCPACEAARYFESPPDGAWVFCPECGTKMSASRVRRRYAGFWIRALGFVIDQAVVFGLLALIWGPGAATATLWASDEASAYLELIFFVATFGYFWIGNAYGATIGRLALGLRVIDKDGNRPGLRRSFIRYLVSIVSGLVLGFGYLRAAWDDRKQTWHDTVAGTYVVRI